ncbi:MAG TPA: glycosyltransferase family 4 protein [Candidatus Omnitrophota bacterium]|nr:glycosyltransferase family 4 protein [Candidatus Omnitrophota bacterium]
MKKIVIISKEPVDRNLKGGALRYANFADRLAGEFEVCLIAPGEGRVAANGVRIVDASAANIKKELAKADVCIYNGAWFFRLYPLLAAFRGKLIIDILPSLFEDKLYLPRWAWLRQKLKFNRLFRLGDHYMVLNRAGHEYFSAKVFPRKATVVPYGVPAGFKKTKSVLRGIDPRIGKDDKVILFSGRLLKWYDPATLVAAFRQVLKKLPSARLVFLGAGKDAALIKMTEDIKDKVVVLDWVDNREVGDHLLEADIAVLTQFNTEESKYCLRIRALDFIAAGLPMAISEGGTVAEMIKEKGGGSVVPPEDPRALAEAILKLLTDDTFRRECKEKLALLAEELSWEKVIRPLADMCRESVGTQVRPSLADIAAYYMLATPLEAAYAAYKTIRRPA